MTKVGRVPRSNADKAFKDIGQNIAEGPHSSEHINYGIITGVDYNTYQVQVQLRGYPPGAILGKGYWPLITQIDEIFHKYGQLKMGMTVRVHWRGRRAAQFAVVEIIGDENADFFKQKDRKNDIPVVPFRLMSGGIG